MSEPTTMICAVCKRPLDRFDGRLDHTLDDQARVDHQPVPQEVPVSQAKLRCDFCHDDVDADKVWRLITHGIVLLIGDEATDLGTEWLADAPCAELIAAGKWDKLFERGVAGYERRHVQPLYAEAKAMTRMLYTKLRQSIISIEAPEEGP